MLQYSRFVLDEFEWVWIDLTAVFFTTNLNWKNLT